MQRDAEMVSSLPRLVVFSSIALLGIMYVLPLPLLPQPFNVWYHQYPRLFPLSHPCIPDRHLHLRPSSPPTPPTPPMPEPEHQHPQRTDQPQKSINQIHPNRMFHPNNSAIPLRVRLNIHIAKQSKERDPEDEQDGIECPCEGDARGEGDDVEQGQDGGEGGDYFCEDPFPITVLVLLIRLMQIHAIETADSEREDDLYEAEDGVRDVGESHFGALKDTHFDCCLCYLNFVIIVVCIVWYRKCWWEL